KQRSVDPRPLLELNAAFPVLLRLALPSDVVIVHPSTDCVFSGRNGPYDVDAPPDATDPYGLSKALAESIAKYPNTVVIRTSIIGVEPEGRAFGLLGWFLSQPDGATVTGFTDHRWNGITTLEWCRVSDDLLALRAMSRPPLVQPGTERFWTKAEML